MKIPTITRLAGILHSNILREFISKVNYLETQALQPHAGMWLIIIVPYAIIICKRISSFIEDAWGHKHIDLSL